MSGIEDSDRERLDGPDGCVSVRCIAGVCLEDVSVVRYEDGEYGLCDASGAAHGYFIPDKRLLQTGPVASITLSEAATKRFERQIKSAYDIGKDRQLSTVSSREADR